MMRKAFVVFCMIVLSSTIHSQTIFQTKDVWKFNKAVEFGFQGTQIGRSSDGFSEWGMGIDFTCYGVYLDYSFLINIQVYQSPQTDKGKKNNSTPFFIH